jgi:nicotinate-nucleotide--dimethylbenzimidazole phosphoribosyltransferase
MPLDGSHTVLVLGGIRSGKSEYAESLVAEAPDVRYIATGPAPDPAADPEWADRVAQHRRRRPDRWATEEVPAEPGRLLTLLGEAKPEQTLLVDDLGGWLAAVLAGAQWSVTAAQEQVGALVQAVRECAARLVIISPEVGLSVVAQTPSGRAFADGMGLANRALAGAAGGVVLVVAGQPAWLKGAAPAGPAPGAPAGGAGAAAGATGVEAGAGGPGLEEALRGPTVLLPPVGDAAITAGMNLPFPDEAAAVAARGRLRLLDVPGPGLGALGQPVSFLAGAQGREIPRPLAAVRVLLLYGVHEGGVAAGEQGMDWAGRLDRVHRGEGPLSLLARRAGADVHTIDTRSAEGLGPARPIEAGDAMAVGAVDAAMRYGWRTADAAVEAGADLLVLAAAGPGQAAVATALVAATTSREPAALLGRVLVPGGAIDDASWMVRCAAVRDALHRVRGSRDARRLLAGLGGPDLAVAVGVLLGAAAGRVPVVLDGPVGVAAALVARELATGARLWTLAIDAGTDPAARAGLDVLSVEPLLKLGLGLGEGANALAALPLVQSALALCGLDTVAPAPGPHVA